MRGFYWRQFLLGRELKASCSTACGSDLPSVTTPEGAEAMHGNLPWNGFIGENEDDIISKSVVTL